MTERSQCSQRARAPGMPVQRGAIPFTSAGRSIVRSTRPTGYRCHGADRAPAPLVSPLEMAPALLVVRHAIGRLRPALGAGPGRAGADCAAGARVR
ncbi:MAG TPA: hypothetical protein ACQGQW_05220, partial [Xylella fastidiosa subsp. pauca]